MSRLTTSASTRRGICPSVSRRSPAGTRSRPGSYSTTASSGSRSACSARTSGRSTSATTPRTRSTRRSGSPTRRSAASPSSSRAHHTSRARYTFDNREFYVQDNWKANSKLTLDYGIRFVHATPLLRQPDAGRQLPAGAVLARAAPAVYVFGCANGVSPCTGTNRQAMNPLTGQFLGPNTTAAVGTLVPGTGHPRNGLFAAGQGIAKTSYTFPTARRRAALRHGLRRHRQRSASSCAAASASISIGPVPATPRRSPPTTAESVTVRYSQLQNLGTGGLTTQGRPVDHRLRVRRQAAHGHGVERGVADAAALGHCRSTSPTPAGTTTTRRSAARTSRSTSTRSTSGRLQPGAAGSDDRAERHSGRLLARRAESQSGARIPRLRHHHLPAIRRLADVPLASSSRSIAGS